MSRKISFAFISILLQPHGAAVQAYTGLVVLLIFFVLHVKCRQGPPFFSLYLPLRLTLTHVKCRPHESIETDRASCTVLTPTHSSAGRMSQRRQTMSSSSPSQRRSSQ